VLKLAPISRSCSVGSEGSRCPVFPCYGTITGRNFIFGPFLADLLEIISFITNVIEVILPVISEQGGVLEITGRAVGNNREPCWK